MEKIIFLDIDGVLVTHSYSKWLLDSGFAVRDHWGHLFDLSAVAELRRIVEETGAKIVLISYGWGAFLSLYSQREMWVDRKMPGELFDSIFHVDCEFRPKPDGIRQYLSRAPVFKSVVIDDEIDVSFIRGAQVIRTNYADGLTHELANKAIQILNS